MSVLIKGISKPKTCAYCPAGFCVNVMERGIINTLEELHKRRHSETIPDDCPYVEIPPHGRLIDADAFAEKNKVFMDCDFTHPCYGDTLEELFADAPTVIEAENAPQNSQNCGEKSEGET